MTSWLDRLSQGLQTPAKPAEKPASTPKPKPASTLPPSQKLPPPVTVEAPKPKPAIKEAFYEIRHPRHGDAGEVAVVFYSVDGAELTVWADANAERAVQKHILADGADHRQVASRLAKAKYLREGGGDDFNRDLRGWPRPGGVA
jgi:hypothetical protein